MTVVKNGMMYFTAPPNVVKIDARTGKTVWRFTAGGGGARLRRRCATDGRTRPRRCCNRRWSCLCRDVRRAGHRAPRRHRRARVEQRYWEDAWTKGRESPVRPSTRAVSSRRIERRTTAGADRSSDDGKTGREVWRWVCGARSRRAGSETWPKTAQWKFGGGALADGRRGRRVRPRLLRHRQRHSQLSGEHREGTNLFICSIVALDMKTGKLKWHYQTIRHDIWEADMSISPVLRRTGGRQDGEGDRCHSA